MTGSTMQNRVEESTNNYDGKTEFDEVNKASDEETFGEVSENDIIDSLTGHPSPEEQPIFAIPVCAPYTAMNKFKLRV